MNSSLFEWPKVNHYLFGFGSGDKALINKAPAKPTDKPVDTISMTVIQQKPLIDKEATNDKPFDSYGYGYWFRFLTVFLID